MAERESLAGASITRTPGWIALSASCPENEDRLLDVSFQSDLVSATTKFHLEQKMAANMVEKCSDCASECPIRALANATHPEIASVLKWSDSSASPGIFERIFLLIKKHY